MIVSSSERVELEEGGGLNETVTVGVTVFTAVLDAQGDGARERLGRGLCDTVLEPTTVLELLELPVAVGEEVTVLLVDILFDTVPEDD